MTTYPATGARPPGASFTDSVPAGPDRRIDVYLALAAFALVSGLAVLLTRANWDSFDATAMGRVAIGLVHHLSVQVKLPYYTSHYSFYGLGMSLFDCISVVLGALTGVQGRDATMLTNVWLLGSMSVLIYAWTLMRGYGRAVALLVGVLVPLGGGFLVEASSGLSEAALGLTVVVCLMGVTAARQGRAWAPYVVGAGLGMAVLVRVDSALLVAPWVLGAVALIWRDTGIWPRLLRIGLAGVPFAVMFMGYNYLRYGGPFSQGYQSFITFNHPFLPGAAGLLVSPGVGLFIYVPLVWVVVAGMVPAWREERMLAVLAIGLVVSRVAFYAPFWGWWGGVWGPRFLLPALGGLAVGLAPALRAVAHKNLALRAVVVAVAAWSVFLGVVGAVISPGANPAVMANYRPEYLQPKVFHTLQLQVDYFKQNDQETRNDHNEFDWELNPLTSEVSALFHRVGIDAVALKPRHPDRVRQVAAAVLLLAAGGAALRARRLSHRPVVP